MIYDCINITTIRAVAEQCQSEFVLVPRKPAREMLEVAGSDALAEDAAGVWQSMIEEYE
jgi:hypothetical protein